MVANGINVPTWTRSRRFLILGIATALVSLAILLMAGVINDNVALLSAFVLFVVTVTTLLQLLGVTLRLPSLRAAGDLRRTGKVALTRALNRLDRVFVTMPSRVKLAPTCIEIQMNPVDLASIANEMEIAAAADFAVKAYRSAIMKYSAQMLSEAPLKVQLIENESVAVGGSQIVAQAEPSDRVAAKPRASNPALRLTTDQFVAESRISGARAGRSRTMKFVLPAKPTVSRVHARFTVVDGNWYITGLGVNGILVNQSRLAGVRQLRDGDVLSWGRTTDAPTSRVEILP